MLTKILIDLLIYLISFKLVEYLKRGYLLFASPESCYLFLILISVLVSSLLTGKYKKRDTNQIIEYLKPNLKSLILSLGLLTIYFNIYKDTNHSRLLLGGTILSGFFVEVLAKFMNTKISVNKIFSINVKFSLLIFLYEFILIVAVIYYPYTHFSNVSFLRDIYSITLLLIIWFISSLFIHQFSPPKQNFTYWHFIWSRVKSNILFIALASIMVFIMLPEGLTLIYPLYISAVYTVSSLMMNTLYYVLIHQSKTDETVTKFVRATIQYDEPLLQEQTPYKGKYSLNNPFSHYLSEQLAVVYLKKYADIYNFINESLDLCSFDFRRCFMIKSADTYNIEVLPENTIELYMNLREINDIRRINEYFITVNSKLTNAGVFVGVVEPISLRRNRFLRNYPYFIASFFYFLILYGKG